MWTPSSPGAAGLAVLGLTAAGLVATATPSVAARDVTAPSLVSVTASATTLDVTRANRSLTVNVRVTDAGSGVASVRVVSTVIGDGVTDPAVPPELGVGNTEATSISGTPQDGVWSTDVSLTAGLRGTLRLYLIVLDLAGNQLAGDVNQLRPGSQPVVTSVITAAPEPPTGVTGLIFDIRPGIGRFVTWTTKPGTPVSLGYAVLTSSSSCGFLTDRVAPATGIRFEHIRPLPCTFTLQVANSAGRSPAKSYTVW